MIHHVRRTWAVDQTRFRWLGVLAASLGLGADGPTAPGRTESIARGDGGTTLGRLVGDARSGFRFEPTGGGRSTPLETSGVITFEGAASDPSGFPPVRVELGPDQRISGRLSRADDVLIRLEDGPGGSKVEINRAGASALAQRPGEALVVRDGWETLDVDRWAMIGEPELVSTPRLEGTKALSLPAKGAAVTYTLPSPVPSGRLEVAFHDPGGVAIGQQWFVDLLFRGGEGPETVRVILDAGEESLGVQSSGGSALAVQRLARKPGWHRLGVRFGPETDLAVDGNELAHGRGPGGPLIEVRLAHRAANNGPEPLPNSEMVVGFDDFRLVRLAEPVGGLEVAPQVDDVRLIDGDQIFGRFRSADPDFVRLLVDAREIPLPWTEVAAVQFRREPTPGRPIDGLLVRVEWRPGPGTEPRDLDMVEGALLAATDASITVDTPYSGTLTIPRDRLKQLRAVGRGVRVVVDPFAHHLGDRRAGKDLQLDPPLPEGGTLERTFSLDRIPDPKASTASVVVDVVQVVGEATNVPFSDLVRRGELRTSVLVNGQKVDHLNRHITTKNESPERVRLKVPDGLLRVGANTIRFEQIGMRNDPEELDNLGILGIAVEFTPIPR